MAGMSKYSPAAQAACTLSCSLCFAAKILYELCLIVFLCQTKPSLLALHGSIAPCPGVHAGAFLRFMGIILQYLSRCASRSFGSPSAGRANPHAPVAFPQNTKYITNKFPIIPSLILYLPTAYQTPSPHTAGAHTSSPISATA